jgi:hypothetical protein
MAALTMTLALVLAAADGGAPAAGPPSLLAPLPGGPSAAADRPFELKRAKNGDLVYEGPAFTARIAPDGTATFSEKGVSVEKGLSLFPWAAMPMRGGGPTLQSTISDLLHHRKPRSGPPADASPRPGYQPLIPQMSPYRPDPAEACQYPRACYFDAGIVLVGVGGHFDVTDELMRLGGQDPYRQAKAQFLAATADLRGGLAARALAANLRRATAELPGTLERIACDGDRSVRARRATIVALRDELNGETQAARDAAVTISRFLETRFDGDRAVRCPPK